ncbi:reo_6 protein [Plakobranchus ocellatus]|uniref:Reo_6 protein n=1 Tax=Plakobranchus ocellatus TaxID=259542 RepID=A0AAV3XTD4_9GAST|nr:reo_6 protein [Plakobranchus ocellatus]
MAPIYGDVLCRALVICVVFSLFWTNANGMYVKAADTKEALDHLRDIISNSENKDPDTHSIICGDFNQANLKTVLPNFYQHVTCPTRGINTLDQCYSKMNSAYKAIERSGLGNSDHSCVLLLPKYIQKVKRSKPVTQTILSWTDSAVEALQDCFEQTDWTTFLDQSTNLHEYSEIVCDYIKFCENVCLPRKTITLFANNNAWFNKQVRRKLHEKDEAYRN